VSNLFSFHPIMTPTSGLGPRRLRWSVLFCVNQCQRSWHYIQFQNDSVLE
jgi:hypothetical protein